MSTTPRTKVARVVTRMNIGGPAWHVTILSTRLGPEFETHLLVGEPDPTEGSMLEEARAAGAQVVRVPGLKRRPSPLDDIRAGLFLFRYFRSWRPEIVATHMAKAGALGRTAAFLARVPVRVHTFHGHVLEGYFGRGTTSVYMTAERLLDRITTRVVAISPRLADDLKAMRIGSRRTAIIRLGLDLQPFSRLPAPGAFRSSLGVPDGAPLVGIVGRLVPIKAHDLFLEMAADLLQRRPEAHFAIVGDGELRSQLEARTAELGLAEHMHFAGWRRDLEAVYGDLDLLVCCSMNEGTPVSVIEACAAGTPVIGTDVGGMSDVIVDGETGHLVPAGDRAALASAVLQVLDHPEKARRLAASAKVRVLGRYSAERLVEDIRMLYMSLLRRPPAVVTPGPVSSA